MKQLLMMILCFSVVIGCNKSTPCEKEIYLIPECLRGKIIVFFNQADGQAIQYEDNARVYHILSSGLLKTQFKRNGGCMGDNRIQFFYEDSLGGRKPIDYFLNIDRENIPSDKDHVLMTFLSDGNSEPDFVIHLLGCSNEFKELTNSVKDIDPGKILKSINNY